MQTQGIVNTNSKEEEEEKEKEEGEEEGEKEEEEEEEEGRDGFSGQREMYYVCIRRSRGE